MPITVKSIQHYPGLERTKVEVDVNVKGDAFLVLYKRAYGFLWKEVGRFGNREQLENFARQYSLYHNKPVEIVTHT